jgi:hypothetical protein
MAGKWILLAEAAEIIRCKHFAKAERRGAIDRIRKRLGYSLTDSEKRKSARGVEINRLAFERWAQANYPGSLLSIHASKAEVSLAAHPASVSFVPMPPELRSRPPDVDLAWQLARQWWERCVEQERALSAAVRREQRLQAQVERLRSAAQEHVRQERAPRRKGWKGLM